MQTLLAYLFPYPEKNPKIIYIYIKAKFLKEPKIKKIKNQQENKKKPPKS